MAKFSGYLNLGVSFGVELGSYRIDDKADYYNKSAMIVDTMMHAGISLFNQADVCRRCNNRLDAETAMKKACSVTMRTGCAKRLTVILTQNRLLEKSISWSMQRQRKEVIPMP